ncbi:MAG: HEAT repeat domain-containing protein [Vampirovibrionales bacterium]
MRADDFASSSNDELHLIQTFEDTTLPMSERVQALNTLLKTERVDVLYMLKQAFDDTATPNEQRCMLALALGQWGSDAAVDSLNAVFVERLESDSFTREEKALLLACVEGLAHTKHPIAQDAVFRCLNHPDNDVFSVASENIRQFGVEAIPELCLVLMQGPSDARCVAAWQLGELKAKNALAPLMESLNDTNDENLQALCLWALGRIGEGTHEVLMAVKAKGQSINPTVSQRAKEVFIKLSSLNN